MPVYRALLLNSYMNYGPFFALLLTELHTLFQVFRATAQTGTMQR